MKSAREQIIEEMLESLELYLDAMKFCSADAWLHREALNAYMKAYKGLPVEKFYKN